MSACGLRCPYSRVGKCPDECPVFQKCDKVGKDRPWTNEEWLKLWEDKYPYSSKGGLR